MNQNNTALAVVILIIAGLIWYLASGLKLPTSQVINQPPNNTNQSPTQTSTTSSQVQSSIKPKEDKEAPQDVEKLVVEDLVVGTGKEVKSGDTIVIHYQGTLTNGQIFDSSYNRGQPFETKIGVGQVIRGWDEGVVGMKVGGKRKLIIPSSLGYGAQGAGSIIPPNVALIFEVELINIK